MEQKITVLILIFVLLIGLYLRIGGTLGGYFAFTFDQGRDFLVLHNLVNEHDMRLIGPPSGIEGVFHGVWWYWFLAPLFFIFSGNPTLVVVSFGVFTASSIIFSYHLGKIVLNKDFGIILASLVSFSPFFIGTSAQLWNPNLAPTLILLLLILLWFCLYKKVSLFWIGIVLGAIFEFGLGFGALFTVAFGITLIVTRTSNINNIVLAVVGFGLWTIPRAIFDFRNNFVQLRSFVNFLQKPQTIHSQLSFFERIGDRFKGIFALFVDAYAGRNLYLGLLVLLAVVFYLLIYLKKEHPLIKNYIKFLIILLALLLCASSVYPDTLWNYYLIGLPSILIPIVGLALYRFFKKFPPFGLALIGLILIYSLSPWSYFKPVWEGDAAVFKNQLAVVDAIYEESDKHPFNVSVYSPSLIDYNYQYLFLWHGNRRYGYIPDRTNVLPLIFFIIEPDPWNKGLREIWIKEREGDGEVLWKKTFPGNIEVEKRDRQNII